MGQKLLLFFQMYHSNYWLVKIYNLFHVIPLLSCTICYSRQIVCQSSQAMLLLPTSELGWKYRPSASLCVTKLQSVAQLDTMVKRTMTETVPSWGRGGTAAAMAQNEQTTEEHCMLNVKMGSYKWTPKVPCGGGSRPPPKTWLLWPPGVHGPNSVSVSWVILAQLTLVTDSGNSRLHTHTHTHTRLTALFQDLPGWAIPEK